MLVSAGDSKQGTKGAEVFCRLDVSSAAQKFQRPRPIFGHRAHASDGKARAELVC